MSTGRTNAMTSASNASKNVAEPTTERMKLCHLETGSRSTRATIVSADRAISLIASPSLWLGALARLAGTRTVPSFNWGHFVRRVGSPARAESAVLRSVEDVAAIDHQQLTGHEVRGVRQEKDHRSDQIVGLLVTFD